MPRKGDEGFTLVESVVAIGIAMVVFMAFAAALITALIATMAARQNQGAIDVLSEQVERVRAEDFVAVVLKSSDLVDPKIRLVGDEYRFDPDGAGPESEERVVTASTAPASLAPHIHEVVRGNSRYTVSSYVTEPAGADGYKRLTVNVGWERRGATMSKSTTTFIASTRRGLPLPKFSFASPVSVTVTPEGVVSLPATITNYGARTSWNVSITTSRSWSWTVYRDDNANGVKDPTDVQVGTSGNWRTSSVESDQSIAFVAVTTLPSSEPLGQVDVTLRAVSVIQPDAASATAEILDRVLVQASTCGVSCVDRIWFLHNKTATGTPAIPGNTARLLDPMSMDPNSPTSAGPFNYDTDIDTKEGRLLVRGGNASGPIEADKIVRWQRVATEATSFKGEVVIRFYAAIKDLRPKEGQLVAYIRTRDASGAWRQRGSSDPAVLTRGSSFKEVVLRVPNVDFTVAAGDVIELMILNPNNSYDDMWVEYDTTSYPAKATFPAVAP